MRRALSARPIATLVTAFILAFATENVVHAPQAGAVELSSSGLTTLHFAEGNTLPGWLEFITILNPNPTTTAIVSIRYSCEQPAGTPASCGIPGDTVTRSIPPLTRDTVAVFDAAQGGVAGAFTGVGATLASNVAVVAERPMYMTQPMGAFSQIDVPIVGAHDAQAVRTANTWYFPEGTTQAGFQQYLTMLNPATATVPATITYSPEGSAPVVRTRDLPPRSRTTIDVVSSEPGALGQQVSGLSTIVTAPEPIVVERPIYLNHDFGGAVGVVNGATDKPGARLPATAPSEIAFAEGNGLDDFVEYITVLNTSATQSGRLNVRYLVEGETVPIGRGCPIGALARVTINVSEVDANQPAVRSCSLGRGLAGSSPGRGVAAQVSADVPITAERPMYFARDFPEIGRVTGAHDVIGVVQPQETSAEFFFAEGSTRDGFDQFWTISNPNAFGISVAVDYLYPAPKLKETKVYDVPASSRRTVQVFAPADGGVGRSGDSGFDFGARAYTLDPNGQPTNKVFGIERPFYSRRAISGLATDAGHDLTGIPIEQVFGPPELELTKSDNPDPVQQFEELTYTLTLRNLSGSPARDVVLADDIPSSTVFVRASGTPTVAAGVVTYAIEDLPVGETVVHTIVVNPTASGEITNTATATAANGASASAFAGSLVLAPPTITVGDETVNEPDSGQQVVADVNVTLSRPTYAPITVRYSTADNTANGGTCGPPNDYITITDLQLLFSPGETQKTVNITVCGDNLDETDESFFLNLSSPDNASISDGQGVITIIDDDLPPG